jgi:hypothetical protein
MSPSSRSIRGLVRVRWSRSVAGESVIEVRIGASAAAAAWIL